MSQTKEQVALSKFMSFALRHKPEAVGLTLTAEGKARVIDLVSCYNADRYPKISVADVMGIVNSCDKQRYSVSEDMTLIWANQGHSIQTLRVDMEQLAPPAYLYHGTATRNYDSIMANGLVPGKRQHVHLSVDLTTATIVGARHGNPVVLKIDARRMHEEGVPFWRSVNGVWLCKFVGPQYIFKPIKENA